MRTIITALLGALLLSSCWIDIPRTEIISGGCFGNQYEYAVIVRAQHPQGTWRITGSNHSSLNGLRNSGSPATAAGSTTAASFTVTGTAKSGAGDDPWSIGGTYDNPCR